MSTADIKPLKWKPDPNIGYTVQRRADGGMQVTFLDTTPETLAHWREFALEHLLDSDRLTRNLYDLRQLDSISDEAIQLAIEVNMDPSVRNIRLAVVADHPDVLAAVQKIAALSTPGGVEMGLFQDLEAAEAWLDRPLTLIT